jgi:hypothetical protein
MLLGGYAGGEAGEIAALGIYDALSSWFGSADRPVLNTNADFDFNNIIVINDGIVFTDSQGQWWQSVTQDPFGHTEIVQYDTLGRPAFAFGQDANGNLFLTATHTDGGATTFSVQAGGNETRYSTSNGEGAQIEAGVAQYDPQTGLVEVRVGPTDPSGNAVGPWHTRIVAVDPATGNVVTRAASTTPAGEIIGPWQTTVEWTEEYAQSLIDTALRNTKGAVIGNGIGEIFGSSLGQLLGGNDVFARIGASSVLSTVLGNVGQSIGIYAVIDHVGLSEAFEAGSQTSVRTSSSNCNRLP